jgi:hypothetical protein
MEREKTGFSSLNMRDFPPLRHLYKDFFKHIFIFSLTKHLQLNKKNYGAVHISVTVPFRVPCCTWVVADSVPDP